MAVEVAAMVAAAMVAAVTAVAKGVMVGEAQVGMAEKEEQLELTVGAVGLEARGGGTAAATREALAAG